jgi:hypothetical protein
LTRTGGCWAIRSGVTRLEFALVLKCVEIEGE